MEFEKLLKLTEEQKKEILHDLIENDVSYWKKIYILMAMGDESQDTELFDLITEHKIEEINLANKKYNLSIKNSEIDSSSKDRYTSAMEKILNGSDDIEYSKACREVLEILKFIPIGYYNKINKNFIERLEKGSAKTCNLEITDDTKYTDLTLSNEAKDILFIICSKFWNENGKTIEIEEIFNK